MAAKQRILILGNDEEDVDILRHYPACCHELGAEITAAPTIERTLGTLGEQSFDATFIEHRLDRQIMGTQILDQMEGSSGGSRLNPCSVNEESFTDRDAMQRMRSGQVGFLSKRSMNAQALQELLVD